MGWERPEPVGLLVTRYTPTEITEEPWADPLQAFPLAEGPGVTWIDFDGIPESSLVQKIGSELSLHPLVLEDIMNTSQRPKIEDYDDYIFLVVTALRMEESEVRTEHVSLVLTKNYVLSFREQVVDPWEAVRTRLRAGTGYLRKSGPDYLAYALLDSVVDQYFSVLDSMSTEIESLEASILEETSNRTLHTVHKLKQQMVSIRRVVWPLREIVNHLLRSESSLVEPGTRVFLRDVYDHTIHVLESVESTRDILSGLADLHLSITGHRLNEVMKVLTVIATIFIPLTFLAGIYGMNFEYMPELALKWAYPVLWCVMIALGSLMILFFKRKGWL